MLPTVAAKPHLHGCARRHADAFAWHQGVHRWRVTDHAIVAFRARNRRPPKPPGRRHRSVSHDRTRGLPHRPALLTRTLSRHRQVPLRRCLRRVASRYDFARKRHRRAMPSAPSGRRLGTAQLSPHRCPSRCFFLNGRPDSRTGGFRPFTGQVPGDTVGPSDNAADRQREAASFQNLELAVEARFIDRGFTAPGSRPRQFIRTGPGRPLENGFGRMSHPPSRPLAAPENEVAKLEGAPSWRGRPQARIEA